MPALVSSCDEDDDGPDVGPRDAGPFGSSSDETSSSSEDVFTVWALRRSLSFFRLFSSA